MQKKNKKKQNTINSQIFWKGSNIIIFLFIFFDWRITNAYPNIQNSKFSPVELLHKKLLIFQLLTNNISNLEVVLFLAVY